MNENKTRVDWVRERERKSLKLFYESGEMIFIMRHLGVTKKHFE